MPEPTTTAAGVVTVATAAVSTSVLTAFGVPLGLRVDLLVAGFAGSLVAIILLNTVPGTGDTWPVLLRTTLRRMAVAFASSLTAGYLTPLAMLLAQVPESLLLGGAFAVGGGAQQVLMFVIRRLAGQPMAPATGEASP
ncbi:hypothetical protein [Melaminivora sp.]|uniref:hypothetical protein n=1 Tax=Melaminivora sp. TaxID=1933032 RepID=UPI0028AC3E47|nr:hypothetical protein [Melaminivora sp.]